MFYLYRVVHSSLGMFTCFRNSLKPWDRDLYWICLGCFCREALSLCKKMLLLIVTSFVGHRSASNDAEFSRHVVKWKDMNPKHAKVVKQTKIQTKWPVQTCPVALQEVRTCRVAILDEKSFPKTMVRICDFQTNTTNVCFRGSPERLLEFRNVFKSKFTE